MRDDDEDAGGEMRMVRVLGVDTTFNCLPGNDEVVVDDDKHDEEEVDEDEFPSMIIITLFSPGVPSVKKLNVKPSQRILFCKLCFYNLSTFLLQNC